MMKIAKNPIRHREVLETNQDVLNMAENVIYVVLIITDVARCLDVAVTMEAVRVALVVAGVAGNRKRGPEFRVFRSLFFENGSGK